MTKPLRLPIVKKHSMTKPLRLPIVKKHSECLELFAKAKNIRDKILLETIYYCGLRVSEAISIKKSDIDFKDAILKVVSGKGGRDRFVPIPKPLSQDLQMWLKLNPKEDDERLFPITRHWVHVIIKNIDKEFHAHTLRHSYATYIYEKTGDIRMLQELLGHQNISTTSIYTHLSSKHKKKFIDEVF